MTLALFPCLPEATLNAANVAGRWLAQDDLQPNAPVDLVILAGNAVIPTIDAACRVASEQGVPLLISGGIGHSTTFLYAAIARHPRYNRIPTTGRAEAAIPLTSPGRSGPYRPSASRWKTSLPIAERMPASAGSGSNRRG